MRNNTGKGMNSRSFKAFWVMLLTLALIIPCMNGIKIQVRADDSADVWKIYGIVSDQETTDIELVHSSDPAPNKDYIGKYVTDGTYTLTSEDSDRLIIANNAEVIAGDIDIAEFKLSGTSSLIYGNYTISSTPEPERFPAYDGLVDNDHIDDLLSYYDTDNQYTPYYSNGIDAWGLPYDLTVNGSIEIDNWETYYDIDVTGNISIVGGGHLQVAHSLSVAENGTVTGLGDDYDLRIFSGATVSGLDLFSESPDNDPLDFSSSPCPDYQCFYYSNSNPEGWINYVPEPEGNVFSFNIGGINLPNDSINVQYKFSDSDNEEYTDASPVVTFSFEGTIGFEILLENIPEGADSVYIKMNLIPADPPEGWATKTMICWNFFGGNPDDSTSEGISGNEFKHAFSLNDRIEISLGYPDSGDPKIVNKAAEYLYAYAGTEQEIKEYLAAELYNRFVWVPMYERFGLDIVDNNGNIDNAANINELASNRITMTGSLGTISAKDINGNSITIPVNNYKVEWGYNQDNGKPVVSNIPVYILNNNDDPDNGKHHFLICTDFDKDNGTGDIFYIRKVHADEIAFDIDGEPEPGTGDWAIPVVVPSIDPDKIVVGGMGGDTAVSNSDNVYAFSFNSRWLNKDQERGAGSTNDPVNYGTLVRMMIESETYVMLKGVGEAKSFGGLNINGYGSDTIWNTRTDGTAEAIVYIGHDTVHLIPLSDNTGLTVRQITAVEVADESIAAGVHIDTDNMSDIKITFDSNFYASIPLNITYSDGGTRKLTINRIGLVINYSYLKGDPNKDVDKADIMDIGFDGRDDRINVKYDYYGGEQIIVYATYYTPTNDPTGGSSDLSLYLTFEDGTHRVITADNNDTLREGRAGEVPSRGFNGRVVATDNAVAATVFLIGFAQAKTKASDGVWIGNIKETYYKDEGRADHIGFYASVLNSGWDDDNSFGGAQIGSGKGIYWDGHISWY